MNAELAASQAANAGFRQPRVEGPVGYPGSQRHRFNEQFAEGERKAREVALARSAWLDADPTPRILTTEPLRLQSTAAKRPVKEAVLSPTIARQQEAETLEARRAKAAADKAQWQAHLEAERVARLAEQVRLVMSGERDYATAASELDMSAADIAVAVFTEEVAQRQRLEAERQGSQKVKVTIAVDENTTVPQGLVDVEVQPQNAKESTNVPVDIFRGKLSERDDIRERVRSATSSARNIVLTVPETWGPLPDEVDGNKLHVIHDRHGRTLTVANTVFNQRELAPTG